MKKIITTLVFLFVLQSCAAHRDLMTPQEYEANFKEQYQKRMTKRYYKALKKMDAPDNTARQLSECISAYIVDTYTPEELAEFTKSKVKAFEASKKANDYCVLYVFGIDRNKEGKGK